MLTYDMGARGSLSMYEYLYRCVRDDIVEGALGPHDRLPSKRALARHLGVSVITVEGAYAQLLAEGYVYTRPRSGVYVSELPQRAVVAAPGAKAHPGASAAGGRRRSGVSAAEATGAAGIAGAASVAGVAGVAQVAGAARAAVDFARAGVGPDDQASGLWARALRNALARESAADCFARQPGTGSARLRQAIAGHLREFRGMQVEADNIIVGAGAQVLYNLVVQLLGHGIVVALEDPGYPLLAKVYAANGVAVRHVPLDDGGMDAKALAASGATLAHIMPSHQLPTGIVTSASRRYELLGWAAADEGRYILEDDYDCEFRMSGKPIPALQSVDAGGRVIYMNTFSQTLSADLRVAYLVLPPALMRRYERELGFYSSTVSAVVQTALACVIESGDYERHLNRVRTRKRQQRDRLIGALDAALGRAVSFEQVDSGLHFVMRLHTGAVGAAEEERIARLCLEQGVLIDPLSRYAAQPSGDGKPAAFVMRYGDLDPASLNRAAAAFKNVTKGS